MDRDLAAGTGLVLISAVIVLFIYAAVLLIPLAIVIFAGYLIYLWQFKSPHALERQARKHTHALYEEAVKRNPLPTAEAFAEQVLECLPNTGAVDVNMLREQACEIYLQENLAPVPSPPLVCNSMEGARYRDLLSRIGAADPERLADAVTESLSQYLSYIPDNSVGDSPISARISDITPAGEAIGLTILPFFDDEENFKELCDQLSHNLCEVSGVSYDERDTSKLVLPSQYEGGNIAFHYLKDTPLLPLFDAAIPLPLANRNEHHWIVAGSGHGKTQCLQSLVLHDLEHVPDRSVVVIDSQGDLLRNISRLRVFAPGERLDGRLVVIDPTDIDYPVALSLFSFGLERLKTHSPVDRQRLLNSVIELVTFVLGDLLSAEMTSKQTTLFNFVIRACIEIPNATIYTFLELLQPGGEETYGADIARLPPLVRTFFDTEYAGREFQHTRQEVTRRLWGILENDTFARMFSQPDSKLDLFSELNDGKVILVNTAKDLLKESGSRLFGRFALAMIAQAAQERATMPARLRIPVYVYIDEFGEYAREADRNVMTMFEQARKYNIGLCVACQYLDQINPALLSSLAANTSIKFAGGVSSKDARALAPMLKTAPETIEAQPKGNFMAYIRNVTPHAVSVAIPFGAMEDEPRMDAETRHAVVADLRARYAAPPSAFKRHANPAPISSADPDEMDTTPQT